MGEGGYNPNHIRIGLGHMGQGRVPHQISPGGRVAFPENAQETPLWVMSAWDVYRWTGESRSMQQKGARVTPQLPVDWETCVLEDVSFGPYRISVRVSGGKVTIAQHAGAGLLNMEY